MDTLKDFFSDLKERISNPFISSFVIGWVIFNYPIIVALLFYKQSELKADGYTSYLNMIQSCFNSNNMFWYPVLVAIIYTFLVPFFKSGIRVFNSWLVTTTDGLVYKTTKNKVVSVEIHTKVSRDLEVVKSQYVALISSESDYKNEIDQLKGRIHTITESNTETIGQLNTDHDKAIQELVLENNKRLQTINEASNTALTNQGTELNQLKAQLKSVENELAGTITRLHIQEESNRVLVEQNDKSALRTQELASELIIANDKVKSATQQKDHLLKLLNDEKVRLEAQRVRNASGINKMDEAITKQIDKLQNQPLLRLEDGRELNVSLYNSDAIKILTLTKDMLHTISY